LVHALDVLCNYLILAQHRLLLRLGYALLAAQSATLAAEAVVLLPALGVVLLDISVESVVVGCQAHHVVALRLGPGAELIDGVLIEALLGLVYHALVVAAGHHLLFADLSCLAAEVVLHALGHVVDENRIGLLQISLLLRAFAHQVV
jgi:hypothetical protein